MDTPNPSVFVCDLWRIVHFQQNGIFFFYPQMLLERGDCSWDVGEMLTDDLEDIQITWQTVDLTFKREAWPLFREHLWEESWYTVVKEYEGLLVHSAHIWTCNKFTVHTDIPIIRYTRMICEVSQLLVKVAPRRERLQWCRMHAIRTWCSTSVQYAWIHWDITSLMRRLFNATCFL